MPLRQCLLHGGCQWTETTSAVARLCSAHLALEKRNADSLAGLHRERAQSQSARQESERLQSRLDEQQRELIALQSRCAVAEAATAAIREESAALVSSHAAAIGQLRERLRRVETANSQLEQLAMDNDLAVPRTIPLLRHSVKETHVDWPCSQRERRVAGRDRSRVHPDSRNTANTDVCDCADAFTLNAPVCGNDSPRQLIPDRVLAPARGADAGGQHPTFVSFAPRAAAVAPAARATGGTASATAIPIPRSERKCRAPVEPVGAGTRSMHGRAESDGDGRAVSASVG